MEATIYADRELTMTMQEFIDANAFYPSSRRQIKKLFAGREALSAIDVLELDIPDAHKLRAVLREELIPLQTLHMLAVEFARAALVHEREAGREPDERSWRALDVKLAWLGLRASDEELEAAKAAAWAAADTATNAAAAAAADTTVRGTTVWAARAASDAAWAAAKAASADADAIVWAANWNEWAGMSAARAAAWTEWDGMSAARAEQVAIVKRMLGLAI